MTSLPPEFGRNQLRLSKKGETCPPPVGLSPARHSPSYSFLSYFSFLLHCRDFIGTPLLFKATISTCTFSFFSGTKRRQTRSYFLLLTVPSPLFPSSFCPRLFSVYSRTHNNKIPSAAISHQPHAWGDASQLWPWNKDTPSAAVGASVGQLHLWYFRI